MQVHGSCAALDGHGVLLIGPAGSGKSDLLLRLMDRGFELVADDRVDIEQGDACPPAALAGLIEVRGLGIIRMPFLAVARLVLVAAMGRAERLPEPVHHLGLPLVHIDPTQPSAAARLHAAFSCQTGALQLVVGALA